MVSSSSPKVDGSIKTLIQGVSQQPPRSRLPGQCTLQENCSSNPVKGLTRRAPAERIGLLFSTAAAVQFKDIRISDNTFIVSVFPDEVRVFDLDADEKTVTVEGTADDYLTGDDVVITTLDSDTYIANTKTICAMDTELPSFVDYGSLVYVRGGQYARKYKVEVSWKDAGPGGTPRSISVEYTTPPGTSAGNEIYLQTSDIAQNLYALLIAVTTNSFNTTFTVTRVDEILYITWAGSRTDTFTVTAADDFGGTNMYAVNNSVKLVSQLPRLAPHGYFVAVTGDGSQTSDEYYLEYSVTPDDQGVTPDVGDGFGKAGLWVETVKSRIPYLIDRATMPHVLEYDKDTDEFTFKQGEWKDRLVGDEDSNPDPSFIGRSINDMGYFQGRLTILSGLAVIMSKTNEPLDFFVTTATDQVDNDPIDMESTAYGISDLKRLNPHNRDLVIFSDNAQFIVFGRNSLTPSNSSIVLTTAFECNVNVAPVPGGRNLFFAITYGNYSGVREFYTDGSTDINDARPITQHVLNYIQGTVRHMASTSNFDTLIVQGSDKKVLYVYEYIWVGAEKAQSSWSKWIFDKDIEYFFFKENLLYMVIKEGNDYILERVDLNVQADAGLNFTVYLDHKLSTKSVTTTMPNPYDDIDPEDVILIQGEGCPNPGLRIEATFGGGVFTLSRDMDGGTVISGVRYNSRYRPTMPFVKDASEVKIGTGKLTISKFFVNCSLTGFLRAIVSSIYAEDKVVEFNGRFVNDSRTVVGAEPVVDNSFVVPFRDNADYSELELQSDSHLPMTVLDLEWVGQYTRRGRRIT